MHVNEAGVLAGSEIFLQTPSELAKELYFYTEASGKYFTDYHYRIKRDFVNCYILFYVISGELRVTSEDNTLQATAGSFVFLDGHKPHEYRTSGTCEFIWIHIAGSNVDSLHRQFLSIYGQHVFMPKNKQHLKTQAEDLLRIFQNEQYLSESRQSFLLYGLLTSVLDTNVSEAQDKHYTSESVLMAMDYIRKNYAQNISLNDIANQAALSIYHFSRIFKATTGYSPHEYLILTRMNRAKYLLKTTSDSIKTISKNVGYKNASTFSIAFTNTVGLSPSNFRKYPI